MRIVSKGLTFVYNKKTKFKKIALRGVNLEIEEGDFFGIIGHTGSGKSTFIQHLNALVRADEGTLAVGEFDLSPSAKKLKHGLMTLRSKVGMVFQYPEYQLFEETVFKDVAFGYKNFFPHADDDEIKRAVFGALQAVGLSSEYANASPFELSGGQKRRVAIAGVIVVKPEILVLDEPVAGLDPVGKRELMRLLHELHSSACKTIIIVSHDMDEVCENCNKIAVFSNGEVVLQGTPKEVFTQSEVLKQLRLDVPITAHIRDELAKNGVEIDTDFTVEDFSQKIAERLKK